MSLLAGLCIVLLVISLPYNNEISTTVQASEKLSVVPKEESEFLVNEPITPDQFEITLGEKNLANEQIFIEPQVCTQAGVQQIWVSCDTDTGYYRQKLSIFVQNPVLEDAGDGTLQGIQVYSQKQAVPVEYVFQKEDMQVMAYFMDGTSKEVYSYQILPYSLLQGEVTQITVQYEGKTASFFVKAEGQETVVENEERKEPVCQPIEASDNSAPVVGTLAPLQSPKATENNSASGMDLPQNTSEKDDITKPVTNVKNKVYKKNLTITFSDKGSGVKAAQLSGDWNGTIVSGYVLKKEGTYTLTITDQAGNQTVVKFSIQKPAKKVELSCKGTSVWKKIQFQAKVTGTNRSVKWKSSNTAIGTINQKGVFFAKRSGSCYVKATIDRITVKKKVVVHKKEKYVFVY